MQSTTENDLTPTAGSSPDRTDQGNTGGIANTHDRALLEALQQFIIPHIGAVANEVEIDERETQSILLKPEAIKLIVAFKEFIASLSSIVVPKESPKKGTVIRVGLDEQGGSRSESSKVSKVTRTPAPKDTLCTGNQENVAEFAAYEIDPELHAKILRGLRDHVFNKMPIRLLRFIPKSSHLEISLIEREEIYAHLVPIMQANIHKFRRDNQDMDEDEDPEEYFSTLVYYFVKDIGQYAILSHTWLREAPGEITYSDWHDQHFDESSPGYQKLVNFCKLAWLKHGLTLGWMDTVCINKESSSELDESIRSMFKWYDRSKVCIAYLAESQFIPDIHRDRWFTRGWTLQELIAPEFIKLCNRNWDYFNPDILSSDIIRSYQGRYDTSITTQVINQISKATSITAEEFKVFFGLSISRRMQLAATREVLREEDTAYSLMGVFDVSIATAYGEGGERAFFRLLAAILESTSKGIFDLFNWSGMDGSNTCTQLFPLSIKYYTSCSAQLIEAGIFNLNAQRSKPLVLTSIGIRIPVVLMPAVRASLDQDDFPQPIGDYCATTHIQFWLSGCNDRCHVLDRRATVKLQGYHQETLAILNIGQSNEKIIIPKTCFAKAILRGDNPVRNKTKQSIRDTRDPIVFEFRNKSGRYIDQWGEEIPVGDLAAHGMQFITLYL
ncbi:hypothetical protein BDN70DRAFT_867877 [Pholiota conissans]|uniref:Heterokaryon incompatibility domain-containing protein n=1 Tax=Pholiota conissans TaxID=109636 RepID=A0A9P5YPA3_9AGAR|nr:hypothetical protein BDN70DRAFT_867877 [Pholiota conissans]